MMLQFRIDYNCRFIKSVFVLCVRPQNNHRCWSSGAVHIFIIFILTQSLSLIWNSLIRLGRLVAEAQGSCSPPFKLWHSYWATKLTQGLNGCQDLTSGSHGCTASILLTEPLLQSLPTSKSPRIQQKKGVFAFVTHLQYFIYQKAEVEEYTSTEFSSHQNKDIHMYWG